MSDIKRYEPENGEIVQRESGYYVEYSDHLAAIAELREANEKLESIVNVLEEMQESITEFYMQHGMATNETFGIKARKFIGYLPKASPKPDSKEPFFCPECEYHSGAHDRACKLHPNNLSQAPSSEWISGMAEKPKTNGKYLVWNTVIDGDNYPSVRNFKDGYWDKSGVGVSKWQPISPPIKSKDHE